MRPQRSLSLCLVLALAACRRDPPPRPRPAPAPRALPLPSAAPDPVAAPAHPSAFAMIPGHPVGDAGIPPAPDPSSGPVVGWDLVPFDDGFGRDDATLLVLTERLPAGPRALVDVGVRGACREVAPPMLRGPAGLVSAVRAVRCEQPEPAVFALTRPDGGWAVARAGCVTPSRACGATRDPESVVGTVAVEGTITARTHGPLTRRDQGMPAPAGEDRPDARARWLYEGPVRDGTGAQAQRLVLALDGPLRQRVDFGAVTQCRAATAAERRGAEVARGALAALVCDTPDEGRRVVSLTRAGDVLRVHARTGDRAALAITQRVGLPRGAALTVAPSP